MRGDNIGTTAPPVASAPVASVPTISPSAQQATNASHTRFLPWALLALGVLYLAWAWMERHERIQQAIQPGNIATNLLNLVKIVFAVIVGMGFLKLGLAKLAAWHVPGAAFMLRVVSVA